MHMSEDVRRKWPDVWSARNWILHDGNARCHQARQTREFQAKDNIISLSHPPYSSYLAPANFYLFVNLKMPLRGDSFNTVAEIQSESQKFLGSLTVNDFQAGFQKCQEAKMIMLKTR